jgi:hypothetical protein
MQKESCLAILVLIIGSITMLTAFAQDQVSQTVRVYENNSNGTALSDVQVKALDEMGVLLEGITDSNGVVVISGQPGTWQFIFMKDGYNSLDLYFNVTETGEDAVYLQREAQNQVTQTVFVHEGDLNGTMLSDVRVTGQDAAGINFEGITDSKGVVVISGQPGTWQFIFMKDGYSPLESDYNVTKTDYDNVYLQKAT